MFCFQCGEKIPDSSKYCLKCGAKLENQWKDDDIEDLKRQFHEDMRTIYTEASKVGYRPTYFLRMISEQRDIVDIARQLIAKETSGFDKLAALQKTNLTVEYFVTLPKYACLFNDDDIKKCKDRLEACKF